MNDVNLRFRGSFPAYDEAYDEAYDRAYDAIDKIYSLTRQTEN